VEISGTELQAWVGAYLWPLIRVAALFSVAPALGAQLIPVRIRVGLAVVITVVIAPLIPAVPFMDPFSPAGIVVTLQQVLIGLAVGFILRLAFSALELGGQIIAMQMGLSFAALVDPQNGVQVPLVSAFYNLMGTLIFLALDGHLMLVELIAESFRALPIGADGLIAADLWEIAGWGSQVFAGALLIALPIVAALMVVNLSFGIMTRAAPQLNLFAVGFPISLMFGLIIILLSLPTLVPQLSRLLQSAFVMSQTLATGGR
jgi:flagellar biosynthetic protein FliR